MGKRKTKKQVDSMAVFAAVGLAAVLALLVIDLVYQVRQAQEAIEGYHESQPYAFADSCGLEAVVCANEVVQEKPKVYQATITPNRAEASRISPRMEGKASWYAKGLKAPEALTAASTEYPRGTRLLVTNKANGKQVEVLVNDYGPNRTIHPDRVVDLSLGAFRTIADPSAGVITVTVIKQ